MPREELLEQIRAELAANRVERGQAMELMAETRETMAATRETMAATRETLNEVRWELQLSRQTHMRFASMTDDLKQFIRDQNTRAERIAQSQVGALRELAVEVRLLRGAQS